MTVVVGTAGHIDHGKTTLLRALTGMDADRLPEERRRGMTIDIGYAHAVLPGGAPVDFVDVPGHDALVGNMLVGAGEIDAALLVVAADDGPRAQTLEHLALLDALGIRHGLAVVTKTDLVDEARVGEVRAAVAGLLAATTMAGAPVLAASAESGTGLDELRAVLVELVGAAERPAGGPARLAIDRVFSVRGMGTVVTGSLRGPGIAVGDELWLRPGDRRVRVRGVQVHGSTAPAGMAGPGRTGVNLAAVAAASVERGMVLAVGEGVLVSDRLLVELRPPARFTSPREDAQWPPSDNTPARLHLGTTQVGARVGRTGREATKLGDGRVSAILRLDAPVAVAVGDRFVLRRPSPGAVLAAGTVLDPVPPRGPARRRIDAARVASLADAVAAGAATGGAAGAATGGAAAVVDALVALHGAMGGDRAASVTAILGGADIATTHVLLAPDVAAELATAAIDEVQAHHAAAPLSPGIPVGDLRRAVARVGRHRFGFDTITAEEVVRAVLDTCLSEGHLARDGDRWRDAARTAGMPAELQAAMARLGSLLAVAAPPALADAAREAGCPPDGLRALEAAGRIVRVEADLAWEAGTYQRLAAMALEMARRGTLTPAAYRDATGTSRKFVLAILEDLGRRGILTRTADGHVPGPRAPRPAPAAAPAHAPAAPPVEPDPHVPEAP